MDNRRLVMFFALLALEEFVWMVNEYTANTYQQSWISANMGLEAFFVFVTLLIPLSVALALPLKKSVSQPLPRLKGGGEVKK